MAAPFNIIQCHQRENKFLIFVLHTGKKTLSYTAQAILGMKKCTDVMLCGNSSLYDLIHLNVVR